MTVRLVRRSSTAPVGRHHRPVRHRFLRLAATLVLVAASVLAVVTLQFPGAEGAYIARISNSGDSAATNPYFTCTEAVSKTTPGGAAYFAYPFGEVGLGALGGAADVSGNGRTGSYSLTGINYGTNSGICRNDNKSAITFDGSSGYVAAATYPLLAIPTPPTIPAPATFSVEVWFQTSTAQGKLIGFGNARTGASTGTQNDRSLYINTNGKLAFGLYNGAYQVITSPSAVTDGNWHYAVATATSTGSALYLDGQLVSSQSLSTAAASYQGYWRIGYDSLAGFPLAATNYYFKGSMAWAAAYTYPLSALQVAQHYAAGK